VSIDTFNVKDMMTEDENDSNAADTSSKYPAWLRIMSTSMTGSSQTSIATENAGDERKDADEEGASIAWANRQSPQQPDPAAICTPKGSQFQPTEEALEKLPIIQRLVLMLRFMYCGCAVLMGVAAVFHALSLTGAFLAAYALFFSCLLCSSSCPFPLAITRTRLIKHFGFLYR